MDDTIKCFVLWLKLRLEVELRMGTENQVGRHLGQVELTLGSSLSKGMMGPQSFLWIMRVLSPIIPDFWRRWTALDSIHNYNRYQFSQNICYNLLPFCSCLGNCEQLDTCYVNCSWIFILGNIEIPFLPTSPPSSSIKNSFELFFHR